MGEELQLNCYAQMHQENTVVTNPATDHTLGAPDSFTYTSTVYINGAQIGLLQTDDGFVLSDIVAQFGNADTLELSGSEVVVDQSALLARIDMDNTLFSTDEAGDSVHFVYEGWVEVAASGLDGMEIDLAMARSL